MSAVTIAGDYVVITATAETMGSRVCCGKDVVTCKLLASLTGTLPADGPASLPLEEEDAGAPETVTANLHIVRFGNDRRAVSVWLDSATGNCNRH